ncbi:hypothetical protein Vau01_119720 [Virgisporangium aurantiacum]|uniref:Uncharacterized protein n=1 Tax=Virgisporangium aurantiacum TaxID=175570 RepID=A0A8J3ZIJ3_9ACTN|nr:hypothetical protein Vau01_119720 [Virgisporangium aurantiacum]
MVKPADPREPMSGTDDHPTPAGGRGDCVTTAAGARQVTNDDSARLSRQRTITIRSPRVTDRFPRLLHRHRPVRAVTAGYVAARTTGAIAGSIRADLTFDLATVGFSNKDRHGAHPFGSQSTRCGEVEHQRGTVRRRAKKSGVRNRC